MAKRTVKFPPIDEWEDQMLVEIRDRPFTNEDFKKLLTEVVLLSGIRDNLLAKQGIHIEPSKTFDEDSITATGLQIAAHLAEKFKHLSVEPKMWQQRVRMYEKNSAGQLGQLRRSISEDLKTLQHSEALQEVNCAYAYLQKNYPVPRSAGVREGELSGMANPDQTIPTVQPDDNGQCPQGTMWSAQIGGCVAIQDGTASTGFDTSKGGNLASSDLRKARSLTGRQQFTPEGIDVRLDQGNSNRMHPDNDYRPNRAMGNSELERSDRNIDTPQMPGGSRVNFVDVPTRSRPHESVREGELSGMANPDKEIEVVPADANGQCRPGWMYSARLNGCIRIQDGTASTMFDTAPGGNTAASDLRKARSLTGRRQFIPEGTKVLTDAGNSDRMHPDNYRTPNRAMGNSGIEATDVGIQTQQMPGGDRVSDVTVTPRYRPQESFMVQEGELSGMANPDQILQGVNPDSKGQCPRGYIFSALVGKCIPLTTDQEVALLKRKQHLPEGTITRLGRTYGHDNSDMPNPAMGFNGPLAALKDEGWISLSSHYLTCMRMLKEARYSYYASKHASERFCFYRFEGEQDGYINGHDQMSHMTVFHLTEKEEQELNDWLETEKKDFNTKTEMDTAYERQMRERLNYRPALIELIRRGRSDQQIQRNLEQRLGLPHETVHALMTDVCILRNTSSTYACKPKPRVFVRMDSDT